jgi:hypothetical protein
MIDSPTVAFSCLIIIARKSLHYCQRPCLSTHYCRLSLLVFSCQICRELDWAVQLQVVLRFFGSEFTFPFATLRLATGLVETATPP